MFSTVLLKSVESNGLAPRRSFAVVLLMLLYSNTCKGQDGASTEVEQRIAGGADAPKERFPYMCSIRKRGNEQHICGGTLIDKRWVMTAAHCLEPDNPYSAGMSPFLYCGIYEREEQDTSKRFAPFRCYLHHLWNGDYRNGNDIALCHLEEEASVAIPDLSNIGDDFTKFDRFSVLGWGRTSNRGDFADALQIGPGLRYILPSLCNTTENWAGQIKNSMMCAGFGSLNSCEGDSGGPLFIRHDPVSAAKPEDPLLDLIVGITSFGLRGCEHEATSVYTRVSCYRPWIDCMIQGQGEECSNLNPCGEKSPLCSDVQRKAAFYEPAALGRTIRALKSDDFETVKEILCAGLSPNAALDRFNNLLLHGAAEADAIKSTRVLLLHGAQIESKNNDGQAPLSRAARYGSASVAKLLIGNGADIETKSDSGWTPLIYAARYNKLGVAQILVESGSNLENKNDEGLGPLHTAAYYYTVGVATLLVENEANVESRSDVAATPLHLAAQRNSIGVAKILIDNGANIESRNHIGSTPLQLAAFNNAVAVAKLLIESGANVNSKSYEGVTPLYFATQQNSTIVAKLLLHNGADTEIKQEDGHTPLNAAAQYNLIVVAKILLENGADVEAKTNMGFTPLHSAAKDNSIRVASELIANGANVKAKTNAGASPLHIAAYYGSYVAIHLLMSENAAVNSTDNDGSTPLHYASSRGHISIVRDLIFAEASTTKTDKDGKTPFDVICSDELLEKPCTNGQITELTDLLRP